MTYDLPIHDLEMTDEEYAQMVAQGYEPILEHQLITCGEEPDQARKLTRFVGLLQEKPPETDEEWEELMRDWEDACGYRPNFD